MSLIAAAILTVAGAIDVWTESSLSRVFPDTPRPAGAPAEIRLYAARGESESFQVCIRAPRGSIDVSEATARVGGRFTGTVSVRRVGYLELEHSSPRAIAPGIVLWPDPLLDFQPFNLEAGQTAVFWVTCHVPVTTPAGVYSGSVAIVPGAGRPRAVPLTLTVFDVTLPPVPRLRTLFSLDRAAVRRMYGLPDSEERAWRPVYDALGAARISFRVWDGGELVRIGAGGKADTELLKRHLWYAVRAAQMNTIDLGAGTAGLAPFPGHADPAQQDPLQWYLLDMAGWLQARGWLDRALIQPMPLPDRAEWQTARDAYFRVRRNDPRIKRLLAGAAHPYFERYNEVWALPEDGFDPHVVQRLLAGVSLSERQPFPCETVTASSAGRLPGAASASASGDGYDGCVFTMWCSDAAPSQRAPQWLEVRLKEPVTTNKVAIIWRSGLEAANPALQVPRDGAWKDLPVTWTEFAPAGPFGQSWAEGVLGKAATFDTARFLFRDTLAGGPVGITEVVFGDTEETLPPRAIDPVEAWLDASGDAFPSFAPDAHSLEARLLPWLCFAWQARGFLYPGLNTWPNAWAANVATQPGVWSGAGTGAGFLFYPGPKAPIPSIRAELLRDGMEDYEYLVSVRDALARKLPVQPDAARFVESLRFPAAASPAELDEMAQSLTLNRIKLGWALGALTNREGV